VDYPERQLDYQRLKTAGIRPTRARLSVIACLRAQPQALNHRHVAEFLAEDIDRVTIYRTLHLLEKKNIVHRVIDRSGTAHYALCSDKQCSDGSHNHQHVHFTCNSCSEIYCVEMYGNSVLQIDPDFQTELVDIRCTGICPSCGDENAQ
jgi:Fur family ferric uptake transcriptional regulator